MFPNIGDFLVVQWRDVKCVVGRRRGMKERRSQQLDRVAAAGENQTPRWIPLYEPEEIGECVARGRLKETLDTLDYENLPRDRSIARNS